MTQHRLTPEDLRELIGPFDGDPPGPPQLQRVGPEWAPDQRRRFDVRPLAPTVGAEVIGVSLADEIDDELYAQLNDALLEWKVLVFRSQAIGAEQQRRFAARWGALEDHPFAREMAAQPDDVEVLRLEKGEGQPGVENQWHSDVTWRKEPSLGSVLRAVELPDIGGDTLWADMGAAYDNLTPAMQDFLDGRTATHDWVPAFGHVMPADVRDALRHDFPPVQHPIVRCHPVTRRKTLYVNRPFTTAIDGLDDASSADLLRFLVSRAARPSCSAAFGGTKAMSSSGTTDPPATTPTPIITLAAA